MCVTLTPVADELPDLSWPAEVGVICSALEAGRWSKERRRYRRNAFKVKATLRLFSEGAGSPQRVLYTRDVNRRSMGFLTNKRLPLGYAGVVKVPSPRDPQALLEIHCTLLRCRETVPGWFEGALSFHRQYDEFLVEG